MPKIHLKLTDVGCRKPNCKRRIEPTSRHHRRNESLFINAFTLDPTKNKTKKYKNFIKRYTSFHKNDFVRICNWHHCEIHLMYDELINTDRNLRQRAMPDYSWRQANALMKKLGKFCLEWEKEDTPGRNPEDCNFLKRFPQEKQRVAQSGAS